MYNSQYSFVRWSDTLPTACEDIAQPLIVCKNDLIAFLITEDLQPVSIGITDIFGNFISYIDLYDVNGLYWRIYEQYESFFADKDYFRLIFYTSGNPVYSNAFQFRENNAETSVLKYSCQSNEFDFNFIDVPSSEYLTVRLPIFLKNKQFPQESNVYVKRNGERIVLSSTVKNQSTIETDYTDETLHSCLVIALACDTVLLDEKAIQSNNDYEIDWENGYTDEYGIERAKATATIQYTTIARNSNCN